MTSDTHVVVTGGAGFIGSHLCRALLDRGARVTAIDNLCTGRKENLGGCLDHPRFALHLADVTTPVAFAHLSGVTHVIHLACPASPKANTRMAVETIRAGSLGTLHALEFAQRSTARVVIASSSEIYGDPQVHPQTEDYRGNTDPVGPYSGYTEAKRVSEAAAAAYHRLGVNVGVVRPFNVYGPFMWPDDGRVVSSFCAAALAGDTLYLQGGGTQTRSLIYSDDFVTGLLIMVDADEFGPINLGSSEEITIRGLAELVIELAGSGSLEIAPSRDEVVSVRRPDTTRARRLLGWQPTTPLRVGLTTTLDWMRTVVS